MKEELVDALVLHTIEYKDSSKIVYLYSEKGHASMIARGVKKMKSPMKVLTQIGTMVNVAWHTNRQLATFKEGTLIDEYPYIHQDILAFTCLSHILELVRLTIHDDADHIVMFGFLKKILKYMEDKEDPEILSFIFELKLLYFLGHGLHLKTCTMCGSDKNLIFHPLSGGVLCENHREDLDVYPKEIIDIISKMYYIDLSSEKMPDVKEIDKALIRRILDEMYDDFVGVKTKSREIYRQLKHF